MSRKLVTVRKIAELLPIDGADAIELAVVDGWKCVVRKGEFAEGDYAVYFEIDSFLPSTDARFESFMKNSREYLGVVGHKLRTIKLRGQISQGLAMPVTLFPEILSGITVPWDIKATDPSDNMFDDLILADVIKKATQQITEQNFEKLSNVDYAEAIGIVKWEPPVSGAVQGQVAGSFPSFIRKTDQERCVSGDTIISTSIGDMSISDICNLEIDEMPMAYSFNHATKSLELKPILGKSILPIGGTWLKIVTKSGRILTVTDNHRIWNDSAKEYVESIKLKKGDVIYIKD